MNRSNIEWAEVTWNPTTSCTKLSSSCKKCYAEKWVNMQYKRWINQYRNSFELTLAPDRLNDPFKWKKSLIVFVNSMSDLFHEKAEDSYICKVFRIMNNTPQHTYQLLTKRIERVQSLPSSLCWSKNIWLGVSVESSDFINRIEQLKAAPAKIKFISFEPLLSDIVYQDYKGIDWVLVGGESGGKARMIAKDWVVSIRNSSEKDNIPFFFKNGESESLIPTEMTLQ